MGRVSPSRQRIVVVFPDPFGPRNPKTPPAGTSRSSPSTATCVRPRRRRYSLRRPSISITGVMAASIRAGRPEIVTARADAVGFVAIGRSMAYNQHGEVARWRAGAGLVISVLGAPRIERDGAVVTFDTRKATALLGYLAVTARPQRRETLAALLWPDADDTRARSALRRTLSVVRKELGDLGPTITRDEVELVDGDGVDDRRPRVPRRRRRPTTSRRWRGPRPCGAAICWPASASATAPSSTTGRRGRPSGCAG